MVCTNKGFQKLRGPFLGDPATKGNTSNKILQSRVDYTVDRNVQEQDGSLYMKCFKHHLLCG